MTDKLPQQFVEHELQRMLHNNVDDDCTCKQCEGYRQAIRDVRGFLSKFVLCQKEHAAWKFYWSPHHFPEVVAYREHAEDAKLAGCPVTPLHAPATEVPE